MPTLKKLISASRLRTLPLSISGAVVGSSYAYYLGYFDFFVFILIILTTISFQVLSNLANDYGDGIKELIQKTELVQKDLSSLVQFLQDKCFMQYFLMFYLVLRSVFCLFGSFLVLIKLLCQYYF